MKILKFLAISLLVTGVKAESIQAIQPVDIVVYRSPACGCCAKWLAHLKENNFNVKDIVTNEVEAIKVKYGVSKAMASCHTAKADNYIIEGHVPAQDIVALLKAKPEVVGLAVPGMPAGTPGMEMGGKKEAYNVMSFDKENHYRIFNSYKGD
ncbi:conserved hypothetical protein [Candidatus Methylobacter favarea]|uniref:DUF411 domain-containing protein n=1 Tax=Candidatus Methylobacter favarea TaxID=2707345 RepID=A0A8S0WAM6_9GAMM|nr:DUF411 domain-containing protein [Candidatus Methylobacter favarea]CAA9890889.1 conserved hypothetical protein [Candidatus Methylobacter favarea]